MQAPKLQVALDTTSLVDAFKTLGNGLDDHVDIIEAGTMLILTEGLRAVDYLRTIYPEKLLVADFKCVAPHFGTQVIKRNPDFITVLSVAEAHVKQKIAKEAAERGAGQQVQVEIYGSYTLDDVNEWKSYGISHVIYNRPRSRSGAWGDPEVKDIAALTNLGIHVTATGGMSYENLTPIAGMPVYAVICGSSLIKAERPAEEAIRIQERIHQLWK